jgi:hypothetical protein
MHLAAPPPPPVQCMVARHPGTEVDLFQAIMLGGMNELIRYTTSKEPVACATIKTFLDTFLKIT